MRLFFNLYTICLYSVCSTLVFIHFGINGYNNMILPIFLFRQIFITYPVFHSNLKHSENKTYKVTFIWTSAISFLHSCFSNNFAQFWKYFWTVDKEELFFLTNKTSITFPYIWKIIITGTFETKQMWTKGFGWKKLLDQSTVQILDNC